jgi:hypothetical protein
MLILGSGALLFLMQRSLRVSSEGRPDHVPLRMHSFTPMVMVGVQASSCRTASQVLKHIVPRVRKCCDADLCTLTCRALLGCNLSVSSHHANAGVASVSYLPVPCDGFTRKLAASQWLQHQAMVDLAPLLVSADMHHRAHAACRQHHHAAIHEGLATVDSAARHPHDPAEHVRPRVLT